MKNKDILLKGLAYDKQVRIYVVRCDDALNEIGDRLKYYPSALAAVGRVASFTTMMGAMLKMDETVTVKVEGDGPIGLIMAEADAHGNMRCYCHNPYCHFEYNGLAKLNVKETVGTKGYISVIKDLKLKEPFIGTIPIINGELAEDFAYYLSVSEQVASSVSLGVLVGEDSRAKSCGGFIIQLLPNTSDEIITKLEEKLSHFPTMSQLFEMELSVEKIGEMLGDESFEIIETMPVKFKCTCSKARFKNGLRTLDETDLKEMIEQDKGAHTVCNFCGKEYNFSEDELQQILKEKTKKK